MKLCFTLFLLLTIFFGNCQIPDSVKSNSVEQTVICIADFIRKDSSIVQGVSNGLLLNDSYVLTVYHGYKPDDETILKSMTVMYFQNSKVDSVKIDLTYQYTKAEYDFSNHLYNPNDNSTDIVVLKLSKKIIAPKVKFATKKIVPQDQLFSIGIVQNLNGHFSRKHTLSTYLFSIQNTTTPECNFFALGGDIHVGFSGSPVYNSKGEIVGMIQSGWNNERDIPYMIRFSENINKVLPFYRMNQRVGLAIDCDYLIQKYLKGFF